MDGVFRAYWKSYDVLYNKDDNAHSVPKALRIKFMPTFGK